MTDYHILRAAPNAAVPNHLLLLGDENQELIDAYLPLSQVYLLEADQAIRGVCVLQVRGTEAEVMNVAIAQDYQGRGLGKALLRHVLAEARTQQLRRVSIRTGNSGIAQLALYQRLGFELVGVHYNHFLVHYPAPIWENGIQCKHQLVLKLSL